MRTLQEKYNAVLEGNFSKEQFRRDAVMQLPNIVSKFNSFEDMTTILKNRGMIAEAKKEEVTAYKKPEVDPIDLIAPDLLDDGIKAELEAAKVEGTPSEEEYAKAKERAAKNLAQDPLCYKNAQTMPEMGEKMEKAKLHEADSKNSYIATQDMANFNTSDIIDKVSDEPVSLALAFKKMVMQNAETYAAMSKDELTAAFKEFKENYYIDQEAQERMDAIAGQPDIPHSLEEQKQLKEAVKALIKKVLTEEVSLEGIKKIDFDFRGDRLLGAYVYTSKPSPQRVKLDQAKELLTALGLTLDPESPYLQLGRDIDAKAGENKDKNGDSIINGIIVTTSDKTFE